MFANLSKSLHQVTFGILVWEVLERMLVFFSNCKVAASLQDACVIARCLSHCKMLVALQDACVMARCLCHCKMLVALQDGYVIARGLPIKLWHEDESTNWYIDSRFHFTYYPELRSLNKLHISFKLSTALSLDQLKQSVQKCFWHCTELLTISDRCSEPRCHYICNYLPLRHHYANNDTNGICPYVQWLQKNLPAWYFFLMKVHIYPSDAVWIINAYFAYLSNSLAESPQTKSASLVTMG